MLCEARLPIHSVTISTLLGIGSRQVARTALSLGLGFSSEVYVFPFLKLGLATEGRSPEASRTCVDSLFLLAIDRVLSSLIHCLCKCLCLFPLLLLRYSLRSGPLVSHSPSLPPASTTPSLVEAHTVELTGHTWTLVHICRTDLWWSGVLFE